MFSSGISPSSFYLSFIKKKKRKGDKKQFIVTGISFTCLFWLEVCLDERARRYQINAKQLPVANSACRRLSRVKFRLMIHESGIK